MISFSRLLEDLRDTGEGGNSVLSLSEGSSSRARLDTIAESTPAFRYFARRATGNCIFFATPLHTINIPSATRRAAGVPCEAHSMRYFFPCTPSPPSCEQGHPPDSLGTGLIAYGAYFWYNIDDRLIGVSEVSGTPEQFTIGFQAPENLHFIAGGT